MPTTCEAAHSPLQGITILDFSWLLPGPFCTMQLADLGANVIKVESPKGDYAREMLPGLFAVANRNKRSLSLDLKAPSAQDVVDRLVSQVDVVIEGFRPGVAKRLGIDYERLSDINPRIVYASVSGFGARGPLAQRPGHDINYLAMSGALSIPGQWSGAAARSGLPVADIAGAMTAALAIVSCLLETRGTGRGRWLDVAMLPSLLNWAQVRAADHLASDEKAWPHINPLNDLYEAKDGMRVSLALVEPHFFGAFCEVAGCQGLLQSAEYKKFSKSLDKHAGQFLRDEVQKVIGTRKSHEWIKLFEDQPVPFAPVLEPGEALANPQLAANGFEVSPPNGLPHGYFPFPVPGLVANDVKPAPSKGQHSDEILRAFGVEAAEIHRLHAEGVIA